MIGQGNKVQIAICPSRVGTLEDEKWLALDNLDEKERQKGVLKPSLELKFPQCFNHHQL